MHQSKKSHHSTKSSLVSKATHIKPKPNQRHQNHHNPKRKYSISKITINNRPEIISQKASPPPPNDKNFSFSGLEQLQSPSPPHSFSLKTTRPQFTHGSGKRCFSTRPQSRPNTKQHHKSLKSLKDFTIPPLTTPSRSFRVALIGAGSHLGQPVAMLLKRNPTKLITSLALYDHRRDFPGVALDISQIPSPYPNSPLVPVETFWGHSELPDALRHADIIISATHHNRGAGMTQRDWFRGNALLQLDNARHVARYAPNALSLIVSPYWLDSFVPLWAEGLAREGVYQPSKLIGVTTINQFRVNSMLSNYFQRALSIPVIGGCHQNSIVPMFSMVNGHGKNQHPNNEKPIEIKGDLRLGLYHRLVYAERDVERLKGSPNGTGEGFAQLSHASSIARFVDSCLYGLTGRFVLNESGYVDSREAKRQYDLQFFNSEIVLGPNGVEDVKPTWERGGEWEREQIHEITAIIRRDIGIGKHFVNEIYDPTNRGLFTLPHPSVRDDPRQLAEDRKNYSVGDDGVDNQPGVDDETLQREHQEFIEYIKSERNADMAADLGFDEMHAKTKKEQMEMETKKAQGENNIGMDSGKSTAGKEKKIKMQDEKLANPTGLPYNEKDDILYSKKYDPRIAALSRGRLQELFGIEDDKEGSAGDTKKSKRDKPSTDFGDETDDPTKESMTPDHSVLGFGARYNEFIREQEQKKLVKGEKAGKEREEQSTIDSKMLQQVEEFVQREREAYEQKHNVRLADPGEDDVSNGGGAGPRRGKVQVPSASLNQRMESYANSSVYDRPFAQRTAESSLSHLFNDVTQQQYQQPKSKFPPDLSPKTPLTERYQPPNRSARKSILDFGIGKSPGDPKH